MDRPPRHSVAYNVLALIGAAARVFVHAARPRAREVRRPTVVESERDADQPESDAETDQPSHNPDAVAVSDPEPGERAESDKIQQQRAARRKRRERRLFWGKARTIAEFLFTAVLAIATSISAWFVLGQWDVMTDTLEETRTAANAAKSSANTAAGALELMRIEQRAYVVVDRVDHSNPAQGEKWEVSVAFKNVGNTPAIHTTTMVGCFEPHVQPPCPPLADPETPATTGNIGPTMGRDSPVSCGASDGRNRRVEMYARYFDMYGTLHHTATCAEFRWEGGNVQAPRYCVGFDFMD